MGCTSAKAASNPEPRPTSKDLTHVSNVKAVEKQNQKVE